MLAQLNDCIGGLLHLGPNVITFRALLHLGPNVITFRTLLHLGQLLHLGLQHGEPLNKSRGQEAEKEEEINYLVKQETRWLKPAESFIQIMLEIQLLIGQFLELCSQFLWL